MEQNPKTEVRIPPTYRSQLQIDAETAPLIVSKTERINEHPTEPPTITTSPCGHYIYSYIVPQEKSAKYTLTQPIGKGSQAELLLANDSDNRAVLVKRITQPLDQETIDLFEHEVTVTRDLYPYSPRITDCGLWNGKPFFARQFIDGYTLDQLGNHRSTHDGLRGLLRVCDTLDYAHKQGIIHADVKPDNILIDPCGKGWLIDWGISTDVDDSGRKFIGGTYNFIAPEQFEGHPCPQSDIYSLGLVLYELATGKPARELKNKRRLEREEIITTAQQPDMTGIHPILTSIITLCTHKEPAARYPDALELRNDLEWYVENT